MSDTIQQLKQKYTDVYTLTVETSKGEEVSVHLRALDRQTYKIVSKLMEKDELSAVESLIKQLWIGGDEAAKICDDFQALRSATISLLDMLRPKEGSLKKN